MNKPKIVIVGSYITDLTSFTPRFPRDGESVIGSFLKIGPGGKGSNAATAAARSGGEITMIAKVGRDMLSGVCFEHYKNEGMKTDYIFVSETSVTGSAIIEVNENTGENRIIVMIGANLDLSPAEIRRTEDEIASCNAVLMQLETNLDALRETIALAKKHCKTIILNPAPAQNVPDGFFEGIDYLTPNETEAEFFSSIPVNDTLSAYAAGEKLLSYGVKNVIITLGKNGAALINRETKIVIPTTDLKAVDTTGAGDAFNGAFTVALSEGKNIIDAIKFANCAASISVTRKGASPSMPLRAESDELYKKFFQ